MKKILVGFLLVALVGAVAGCGVRSELARPESGYPRNYPVH